MDNETQSLLKHEYSEVNQNFRHYSNLRFAIFTVFFAITGVLIASTFGISNEQISESRAFLKLGGVIVTLVFFVLEHILNEYLRHFAKVAVDLEQKLGYTQFSTRPTFKVQARHATYALYILFLLFWIYALIFR